MESALSRPLVFGDREQIEAIRRIEAQHDQLELESSWPEWRVSCSLSHTFIIRAPGLAEAEQEAGDLFSDLASGQSSAIEIIASKIR